MKRTPVPIFAYGLMVLGAVGIFYLIQTYGGTLTAPAPALPSPTQRGAAAASSDTLWHLLLALTVVAIVGRVLKRLFSLVGQPPVIGEVVGGILLGPSLLGAIAPDVYHYILPSSVAPYLGVVAQLGVILYMFLVGLELNPEVLRGQVHTTVVISHASILLPFTLGAGLALYLYPHFSTSAVPFTHFALFLGVAMSITAFPVLARILSDCGLIRTDLGVIALTCAAVDDVTAWCLLAFVVGVVQSSANGALIAAVLTLGFMGAMFGAVRPLVARLTMNDGDAPPSIDVVAIALIGALIAALITEAIGVHAIFGAFLFGVVIPHGSNLARTLRAGLEQVVTILLLPAFFAFTGMRTEIALVSSGYDWAICGAIVLVATVGKFGGSFAAARIAGLDWRRATGLGVLMNTRGLMELIVLNVGFELGVISPTVFTMMVLMALATTIATTPVLQHVLRRGARTSAAERFEYTV